MKKITTLFLLSSLVWIGSLQAQFNVDWAYDYKHTNSLNFSNEGRKVVVDSTSGFVYTLNDVTSDIDPNGVITGQTYSYVVLNQFDDSGNLLDSYEVSVGNHFGTGYDLKSSFGLQVDASGDIYIGYNNFDVTTNYDVNLSKLNNQLNLVWSYKFNATTEDLGIAMQVEQGNSFAILKSTAGANIRHRIIKATAAGTSATPLFSYNSQPDFLTDLVVDNTLKVYTTGYRLVAGAKVILMSCVTGTGTLLWSRVDNCGSVTGDDFIRDITLGTDGFLYVTGSSQGTVQHGIDAVSMKYNPVNGKKMWESFINFNLTDGGYFILNPDLNFCYISWAANSTIYIDQLDASSGLQVRRITYAPIPVTPYSSLGATTVTDMKMSKRKNIYLTGSIAGVTTGQNFSACYMIRASFTGRGLPAVEYEFDVTGQPSGSFRGAGLALDEDLSKVYFLEDGINTFANHQEEISWLVGLDVPTFLRTVSTDTDLSVKIFNATAQPNPVQNELSVRSNKSLDRIEIQDLNGKLLSSLSATGLMDLNIDMTPFANGIYLLKIYDQEGNSSISKIIK